MDALGKKTPILKRVDKAAKEAAKRGGPDTDRGYKPVQLHVQWLAVQRVGLKRRDKPL